MAEYGPPRNHRALLAMPGTIVVGVLLGATLVSLLLPLRGFVAPLDPTDGKVPTLRESFDPRWLQALSIQLAFTSLVLLVELPLGVLVALAMPRRGVAAGIAAAAVAWPLLLPPAFLDLLRTEAVPRLAAAVLPRGASSTWGTDAVGWCGYVFVDAWRWTPLVVLLCAFALRRGPALELSASLDGLSPARRLRHVHWPRLRRALGAAALLRIADSSAAWTVPDAGVSLAAWLRERLAADPGPGTSLTVALTLLLLALLPMPPLGSPREGA